jgi:hypothetical protein
MHYAEKIRTKNKGELYSPVPENELNLKKKAILLETA